ncbi:hypothetical protein CTI55_26135 (plasmid) [Klebsiella pneumoniae]|nr:hypothetical protein CTI55_26135 [Klebsiella pneumoniae]ATR07685.1 hypothetical protein CTI56_27515 [Klebsiella pneumoniae]ATR18794.1 hypothetical protein CTI58_27415 [Klebsiella pneumoniae]
MVSDLDGASLIFIFMLESLIFGFNTTFYSSHVMPYPLNCWILPFRDIFSSSSIPTFNLFQAF